MNNLLKISFFIVLLLSASCVSADKEPENVRELMEYDGWEYCGRVIVDSYRDKTEYTDALIFEDAGQYDLFQRGADYALTVTNSDTRSLSDYDSDDDHFESSTWINHYAVKGDYSVRGDHARRGTGSLGVITKRYNAKAVSESGNAIYFNLPELPDTASENEPSDSESDYHAVEDVANDDNEPVKKYTQCTLCYGTTRCGACGGSGQTYNAIDYSPGQFVSCSSCGGSGACPMCEGSGVIEDFSW